MYRGLWNLLPGGVVLKTLLAVLLAVGVFFLLMEVVFPYVAELIDMAVTRAARAAVFPYVAELMPYSDVSV